MALKTISYMDKNKNGMIEVSEFNDFCKKTEDSNLLNNVLMDYYNTNDGIFKSFDLKKAIEAYEGGRQNEKIK